MVTDLSGLNEQQLDCVLKSVDHNVVLLAGAGSGKTFTLVKRTEYLIRDLGVDPSNIMMVTFTRKAAREMHNRILKMIPSGGAIQVGTIHSISLDILKRYGIHVGLCGFDVIVDKKVKEAIKSCFDQMSPDKGYGNCTAELISKSIARISHYKANGLSVKDVRKNETERGIFKDIYEAYTAYCREHNLIDYDDMITKTVELLENHPNAADAVHQRVKYLMVDETQDTSLMQHRLLSQIVGDNNLMMVGDISQSIYGFRNAMPEYLETFAMKRENTIKLKLEMNYRSTRNIVEAANALIINNHNENSVIMRSEKPRGSEIHTIVGETERDEAAAVVTQIQSYILAGKKASDIAIIYRAHFQATAFKRVLADKRIPYVDLGNTFFLDTEEVAEMLSFCNLVLDPMDENAFRGIMIKGDTIPRNDIDQIVDAAYVFHRPIIEILRGYVEKMPFGIKKDRTLRLLRTLEDRKLGLGALVAGLVKYTKFRDAVLNTVLDPKMVGLGAVSELVDKAFEYDTVMQGYTLEKKLENFEDFYYKLHQREIEHSVVLTTAHTSKGLEWDTVYVVGAREGIYPISAAVKEGDDEAVEEERRLFYVAMTRAKTTLCISRYFLCSPRQREGVPHSRFITEIPDYCFWSDDDPRMKMRMKRMKCPA